MFTTLVVVVTAVTTVTALGLAACACRGSCPTRSTTEQTWWTVKGHSLYADAPREER